MTMTAMVILMPHSVDSHATVGSPSAVSAELTMPKLSENTEPKTMAIATMLVTLGMKKATR